VTLDFAPCPSNLVPQSSVPNTFRLDPKQSLAFVTSFDVDAWLGSRQADLKHPLHDCEAPCSAVCFSTRVLAFAEHEAAVLVDGIERPRASPAGRS
jgi:hypothetical protein